ncbi:MAG TPA: hypothetical protein VM841_05985 [Actinomycetota bacterium]|nr:hypothetical protein [Actinomycetota bacterium]
MSPRTRLLLGSLAGLAAAVVVLAAANATWRTVTTSDFVVTIGEQQVVLDRGRAIKGTTQDASLALFAIVGAAAALVAPMLSATPRMGASAFLGASGLMISASAAITRGIESVPEEWLSGAHADRLALSPPTAAPLIAVAGGIAMIAAAAWLLTRVRNAPRLTMPEGPPGAAERDEGAWE